MKVPALINFTDNNERLIFGPETPEYKALHSLKSNGEFKSYQSQQLALGASVRYDATGDIFSVMPDTFQNNVIKEDDGYKKGKKQILQDDEEDIDDLNSEEEDVDIEISDDDLDRMVNPTDEDEENADNGLMTQEGDPNGIESDMLTSDPVLQPEQNNEFKNNNQMQVVSLDDLMSILQQITGGDTNGNNQAGGTNAIGGNYDAIPAAKDPAGDAQPAGPGPLVGGKEGLETSYFLNGGKDVLGSEFESSMENIHNLESHIDGEKSYVNVIGASPKRNGGIPQPGAKALGIDNEMDYENPSACFDDEMSNDAAVSISIDSDLEKIGSNRPEEDFNGNPVPNGASRLVADLPNSDDFEDEENYEHDDDTEMLLDIEDDEDMEKPSTVINGRDEDQSGMMEAEGDDFKHPDLDRFGVGDMDYSPEDEVVSYEEDEFEPDYEEEITPAVNVNQNMNLQGQRVQIMLTGVMITMPELTHIGETIKKAGNKLKKIVGKGNTLNMLVEANDKQYVIKYVDQPTNKTKTPFSIRNNNFKSLEEALDRINYKRGARENEVFNKIVDEGVLRMEVASVKESNIFSELNENIKYVAGWNVMPVGYLNLKTCMNETFSRITQSGKEPNTLILTEAGEYYLLKGNMKERSKIGTKKEIVNMKEGKSYGVSKVVGIYENTAEGLGEIMYKIKRTSIPLLVWR